jgi:hypothetical protein
MTIVEGYFDLLIERLAEVRASQAQASGQARVQLRRRARRDAGARDVSAHRDDRRLSSDRREYDDLVPSRLGRHGRTPVQVHPRGRGLRARDPALASSRSQGLDRHFLAFRRQRSDPSSDGSGAGIRAGKKVSPTSAEPDYPVDHEVRRVRSNGEIKWRGKLVYLNCPLARERVGLAENAAGCTVSFGPVVLGSIAHGGDRLRKPKPAGCGLVDNAARCPQGPQPQQQHQQPPA